jgi:hypothetical protein
MSFKDMCTDTVRILSASGDVIGEYKAAMSQSPDRKVHIFETVVNAGEGDELHQIVPGGRTLKFIITDVSHDNGFGDGDSACWCLTIEKATDLQKKESVGAGQTFNISGSTGVQIGNQNSMQISDAFKALAENIDKSDVSEEEKKEAKGLLAKAVEHPLLSALLGGLAQGIITALKN